MPLSLRRGRVSAIVESLPGLVRCEVDGAPCVAFSELTGSVEVGDDVVVNVQAGELALGSGGFDVLYANLTRGLELAVEPGAHVMKLPYTPLQFARRHAEEDGSLDERLEGMPVVCCSLHSQVAPVCAALRGLRVAYVQLPGGALPVALSDAVRTLKGGALLESSVGVGACFGGDVDTVNVYSALAWARSTGMDVVVCGVGPGIVGTGTRLGHGAMAAAGAAAATEALGGKPVLAARVSERDPRPRHHGMSHHVDAVLAVAPRVAVAWPEGCPLDPPEGAEIVQVGDWREACAGLPLSHMGRGPAEDPWFFAAGFAAGRVAKRISRR
jgi:hypothetical protein